MQGPDKCIRAVTASKIASNAVTSSKISDGTIGYADVSKNLIAVEHRSDCNCGGTGWDPDGTINYGRIYDDRITSNSVVSVSILANLAGVVCSAQASVGFAVVGCTSNIRDSSGINYAIFNNPAYN